MRALVFLLILLICGLANTVEAQRHKGLFSLPITAETRSGIPPLEDPSLIKPRVRYNEHFSIRFMNPELLPDPANPARKQSDMQFKSTLFWKTDESAYAVNVYCDPKGYIYYIERNSKWGLDVYGFGEDVLLNLKSTGFEVNRKGEIDFKRPYVLQRTGDIFQAETYKETTWTEKFYEVLQESMQNIVLPQMNGQEPKILGRSPYDVSLSLNFQPPPDFLWKDAKGKVIKPNLKWISERIALAEGNEKKANAELVEALVKK